MDSEIIYLKRIYTYLTSQGIEMKPCNVEEIRKLEEWIHYSLPEAYKEFLSLMGKGARHFMRGSSCFYNDLFNLRQWAEELLIENKSSLVIPKTGFVFWMHQGYQFAFFDLAVQNDNPLVYYFIEGKTNSDFQQNENLVEFLTTELKMIK